LSSLLYLKKDPSELTSNPASFQKKKEEKEKGKRKGY